jgi:CHAT domain-containing protein/tetratricopeptide (TPR) repeat protein
VAKIIMETPVIALFDNQIKDLLQELQGLARETENQESDLSDHQQKVATELYSKLADTYFQRYLQKNGTESDAEKAIHFYDQAVWLCPGSEDVIELQIKKGKVYLERMCRTAKMKDVEEAEEIFRQIPCGYAHVAERSLGLAQCLHIRYKMTGERGSLETGLELLEDIVSSLPITNPNLSRLLCLCGSFLRDRAEMTGSSDDLDIAVGIVHSGLNLETCDALDQFNCRLELASILKLRLEALEFQEDLEEAKNQIKLAALVAESAPHKIAALHLCSPETLMAEFELTRQGQVLSDAGSEVKRAIDNFPDTGGHSILLVRMMESCSSTSFQLWIQTKDTVYLNRALNFLNTARKFTRAMAENWKSSWIESKLLFTLGEINRFRHRTFTSRVIAKNAYSCLMESVEALYAKTAIFSARACYFAEYLMYRHQEFGFDTEEETKHILTNILLSPLPLRLRDRVRLAQLYGSWFSVFHQNDRLTALEKCCRHCFKSFELCNTSFSPVLRREVLAMLGSRFIDKGDISHDFADYETAAACFEGAREISNDQKCPFDFSLLFARLRRAQYSLLNDTTLGEKALEANYNIIHNRYSRSSPIQKLNAVIANASLELKMHKNMEAAMKCVSIMLDLLPEFISMGHSRKEQLSMIRAYPLDAVYVYARYTLQQPGATLLGIIQRLETGRNFTVSRLLGRKVDIDQLRMQAPDLASRFRAISNQLSSKNEKKVASTNPDAEDDTHHLAVQLKDLLAEIRSHEMLSNFQLPPQTMSELQSYAVDGPVVFIVPGGDGGSGRGIVITHTGVSLVQLPDCDDDQAKSQVLRLKQAVSQSQWKTSPEETDKTLNAIFKWLWEAVANPVIASLDASMGPQRHFTGRLWWIPCSWLALLPLHAAGDHPKAIETGDDCTLMDRGIVSSYIPTLQALRHMRNLFQMLERETGLPDADSNIRTSGLLVALSKTRDKGPLAYASAEIGDIASILQTSNMAITALHNAQATRDAVKAALRRSAIAHFACHGEAHAQDPLHSTLFLHDWRENRFSVEHLISVAFNPDMSKVEFEPKCKLAFLSACESAAVSTTEPRLRDETIHLAVAFQIGIGIPHVIATWWKLLDAEAVRPACGFYERLKVRDENEDRSDSSDGGTLRTKIDVARTPYAVDGVVRELRQNGLSPFVWGAYVHFGP